MKTSVLIVEDSRAYRQGLCRLLGTNPSIQVVGAAANGEEALAHLEGCTPNVVVTDLVMPVMDGLALLSALNRLQEKLPVIVLTTTNQADASELVSEHYDGHSAVLHKDAIRLDGTRLFEQIAVAAKNSYQNHDTAQRAARPTPRPTHTRQEVIAIAASTGGPKALRMILAELPHDFPAPILISQHGPNGFARRFAEDLDRDSQLQVKVATHDAPIRSGCAYIAPSGRHLSVARANNGIPLLKADNSHPVNSCLPSADVLFRSAAHAYGSRLTAVVLTGLGEDGKKGCEEVARQGGIVIAQDKATSTAWGMPGAVSGAGIASSVVPLDRIARRLRVLVSANEQNSRK